MDTNDQYFDCLCRTCMNELVEATSYDGNTNPQPQWQSIFDRIEECGAFRIAELLTNAVPQIEVQPRDELPKRICCKCLQELLIVYRFQQMCIQSEQQMRQQVSKERTDLEIPMIGATMEGEIETHKAGSYPLTSLQPSSTHQNLEHSSIQESLLETTEQMVKPEAAETSDDDIDKLLEDCRDAEGNFSEFLKNEPNEDDEPGIEYSNDGTTNTAISEKNEQLSIEFEEQQINETNVKKHHSRHAEDDKPYKCPYCTRKFNTISNMYQHKARHEAACDICGKCIVKSSLKNHKLTHSNEKEHKCDFCGKRFNLITYLRNHIRTHTGEEPYKCKYCDRSFTQASNRTAHMRIHYRDNGHRCELCPLAFSAAKELRVHFATHKDEDSETRERNMKALKEAEAKLQVKLSETETQQPSKEESKQQLEIKAKENVRTYRFMHGEDKPYGCPYCPRRFNDRSNMHRHKLIHEGVKRVACDICGNSILKTCLKTHMYRHKVIHEGVKRVACDICGISILKTSLKTHKLIHNKEKAHKCDICDMGNVKKHHSRHAEDKPYKCPYCTRKFNTISNMYQHKARHEVACDICGKSIVKHNFKSHKLTHSNEKAHKCDLCGKCFVRIGDLRRHIRKHTGENPYKCKYCESSFNDPSLRIKHMRRHLGDNIYRCELCPLAFPLDKELRAHLTEHDNDDSETRERNMKALKESEAKLQLKLSENETQQPSKEESKQQLKIKAKENVRTYRFMPGEDKPYGCPYCPRRFNDSSNMHRHKVIHEGVKRVACDICGKSILKTSLRTHKLIHSKEKAHKCDICEMGFAQISNLRIHMRKHSGEKPYKCKYCERSFSHSSHRINHMRFHLGDNVHRCKLCPLAFPLAKELRAHLTEHNNEDSETRERNMKALKEAEAKLQLKLSKNETQQPPKEQSQQQYEMPVQKDHSTHAPDKPYKCPYCRRKFNTISNMYQHKARHEVACDICGKTIVKNNLKKHKLMHSNEKAHKCDFCGKCFARNADLRCHIRRHTGEKPYKCKYCERSFNVPSRRIRHMRLHLGDNIYRCELCPLAFPLAKELRAHLTEHDNDDSETRERNMKALKEAEAKLQLKLSKEKVRRKKRIR